MFPTLNTTYVSQGLAKFTSRYTQDSAPNLLALASAYLGEIQLLETAIFAVIEQRWLVNAVGVNLDIIGDLVGQLRMGLDDNTYRAAIRLRIKANRSKGRAEDVIVLAVLIATELTSDSNGVVKYLEGGIYDFSITITNLLYAAIALSILSEARAITSHGQLIYSTWADGNDFEWDDVNNPSTTGQGTWGDTVAGVVGGLLLSAQGL